MPIEDPPSRGESERSPALATGPASPLIAAAIPATGAAPGTDAAPWGGTAPATDALPAGWPSGPGGTATVAQVAGVPAEPLIAGMGVLILVLLGVIAALYVSNRDSEDVGAGGRTPAGGPSAGEGGESPGSPGPGGPPTAEPGSVPGAGSDGPIPGSDAGARTGDDDARAGAGSGGAHAGAPDGDAGVTIPDADDPATAADQAIDAAASAVEDCLPDGPAAALLDNARERRATGDHEGARKRAEAAVELAERERSALSSIRETWERLQGEGDEHVAALDHVQQARDHLREGDFEAVEDPLERASAAAYLAHVSEEVEGLVAEAREARATGRYDQVLRALSLLEEARETVEALDPDDLEVEGAHDRVEGLMAQVESEIEATRTERREAEVTQKQGQYQDRVRVAVDEYDRGEYGNAVATFEAARDHCRSAIETAREHDLDAAVALEAAMANIESRIEEARARALVEWVVDGGAEAERMVVGGFPEGELPVDPEDVDRDDPDARLELLEGWIEDRVRSLRASAGPEDPDGDDFGDLLTRLENLHGAVAAVDGTRLGSVDGQRRVRALLERIQEARADVERAEAAAEVATAQDRAVELIDAADDRFEAGRFEDASRTYRRALDHCERALERARGHDPAAVQELEAARGKIQGRIRECRARGPNRPDG